MNRDDTGTSVLVFALTLVLVLASSRFTHVLFLVLMLVLASYV